MIYTAEHIRRDQTIVADLCVVGSGAGGAPVAWEAARHHKKVVVLEAGRFWRPKDFTQLEHEMFPRLYHEKGGRTTHDKAIHVHQGLGVGGSTLHNLNLCARLPQAIEKQWREMYGLSGLPTEKLHALYAEVEKHLSVRSLNEGHLNGNNRVFKRGVEALRYRGGYMKHNREGCAASGFCELGCPFDAKQNALKMYHAPAVEAGAMIVSDTWATKIRWHGTKAQTVEAVVREPQTGKPLHRINVEAKVICVSASATGTPTLLQRSQIPDPYALLGSRLFLHPGVAVAGLFEETLQSWAGVPQAYECTEFLDFDRGSQKRVWIIPAFAHPVGASSILAGFGSEHARYFRDYHKMAAFTAMIHDETSGTVRPKGDLGVDIRYWPDEKDRQQLALGLRECAKIMQAAGAKTVMVPFSKTQEFGRDARLEQALQSISIVPHDLNITAVHPMGSVWMGDDPKNSCVSSLGRYHHLDNVFVADTSLFPSSIGTPPQLTAYTLGLHVGRQILTLL